MRHLIDPLDFTLEETTKVLDLADRIAENPEVYSHVADGKKDCYSFLRAKYQNTSFLLNLPC